MIVSCTECNAKYNLDEGLIKAEGSRVRCSLCKHVFTIYPPELEKPEESEETKGIDEPVEDFSDDLLEETVALDSPPDFSRIDGDVSEGDGSEDSFEKTFEDVLENDIAEGVEDLIGDEDLSDQTTHESSDEGPGPSSTDRPGKTARSRGPLIALFSILGLVVIAIAIYFFMPGILPDWLSFLKPAEKEAIMDIGVTGLDFRDVEGSFITNSGAGQLFVIKGAVLNNNSTTRSHILLKGAILDDTGNVIKQRLIYAGNTFSDKDLMELPLEEINNALKNRSGQGDINVNIPSGSSIPFMIVFEELPDNLGEFIVEAVSSSKGE